MFRWAPGHPGVRWDAADIYRAGVDIQELIDQHQIKTVLYRYCRGIDRRDFAAVRACYHPDATDDHGNFVGGVEEFLGHVQVSLSRFRQTMHQIANVLIEIDGDVAWSEAYVIAYHRLPASATKPERDFDVALRYIDRFERRDGHWAIASRRCVFTRMRMDPARPLEEWGDYRWGGTVDDDPVYER